MLFSFLNIPNWIFSISDNADIDKYLNVFRIILGTRYEDNHRELFTKVGAPIILRGMIIINFRQVEFAAISLEQYLSYVHYWNSRAPSAWSINFDQIVRVSYHLKQVLTLPWI